MSAAAIDQHQMLRHQCSGVVSLPQSSGKGVHRMVRRQCSAVVRAPDNDVHQMVRQQCSDSNPRDGRNRQQKWRRTNEARKRFSVNPRVRLDTHVEPFNPEQETYARLPARSDSKPVKPVGAEVNKNVFNLMRTMRIWQYWETIPSLIPAHNDGCCSRGIACGNEEFVDIIGVPFTLPAFDWLDGPDGVQLNCPEAKALEADGVFRFGSGTNYKNQEELSPSMQGFIGYAWATLVANIEWAVAATAWAVDDERIAERVRNRLTSGSVKLVGSFDFDVAEPAWASTKACRSGCRIKFYFTSQFRTLISRYDSACQSRIPLGWCLLSKMCTILLHEIVHTADNRPRHETYGGKDNIRDQPRECGKAYLAGHAFAFFMVRWGVLVEGEKQGSNSICVAWDRFGWDGF